MRDSWLDARGRQGGGIPWIRSLPATLIVVAILSIAASGQSPPQRLTGNTNLPEILTYIHNGWDSLTRSTNSCAAISDTKLSVAPILYLPFGFQEPTDLDQMKRECRVTIAHLPQAIHQLGSGDSESIQPPGLLYLTNNYVVPGGRFNEMYGWDSYFIIRGLLRDGRLELARGMVENFFFEVEHYGAVLNANRTYYLTRSQPPFLSSMVMAVHEAQKRAGQDDSAWMATAYGYIKRAHSMWTRAPHLAGGTGLSRYYDFGEGPAVESLLDETDTYRKSLGYFIVHPSVPAYALSDNDHSAGTVTGPEYSVRLCNAQDQSSCEPARNVQLTRDYYKGDRSMRESGFDISFRFGPYGVNTHHFAPVCLNSLLYRTESDLAEISSFLGKKSESAEWHSLAEARKKSMQQLWDDRAGMFFDFNFEQNRKSTYRYATTFYPMWAGLATATQAKAIMKNLGSFERPGGLAMSVDETHVQWDYPYGWAPIQLLAVEGMRRYGYDAEADRISAEFLSMVFENFERDGTIREKYNVVTRSSETEVRAGYTANVIGFGWTNAVFVELLDSLSKDKAAQITAWPRHPSKK